MDALIQLPTPKSHAADLVQAPITFDEQKVAGHQCCTGNFILCAAYDRYIVEPEFIRINIRHA